jgi:hypothetical protein
MSECVIFLHFERTGTNVLPCSLVYFSNYLVFVSIKRCSIGGWIIHSDIQLGCRSSSVHDKSMQSHQPMKNSTSKRRFKRKADVVSLILHTKGQFCLWKHPAINSKQSRWNGMEYADEIELTAR